MPTDSPSNNWMDSKCLRCPRLVTNRKQIVRATQPPTAGLLAIGEAPGADEDEYGVGFKGKAGDALHNLLAQHGLTIGIDYGIANICRCRPPGNAKPTPEEISSCLPYLISLIDETRPKVILAVGGRTPVSVLCGTGTLQSHIYARNDAKDWRSSFCAPRYDELKAVLELVPYVVPMPHTSPRVMNNKKWAEKAREQVDKAVELLRQ